MILEKTPESPLDRKEIKAVNLKGNKSWIVIGRTDAEAETPVFWSSDANSWLIRKVPDAGKDWGQKEKRALEHGMTGWHHQCNGYELGQTFGDGEVLGGLVCCTLWGHKESDMTRQLNNNVKDICEGIPGGSGVKNPPANAGFDPWVEKMFWKRKWQQRSIPQTEEPGRLQSMALQRTGHD